MFMSARVTTTVLLTLGVWVGAAAAPPQRDALSLAVSQGSTAIVPGSVVLVTVAPSGPVASVEGTAFGRAVRFWASEASNDWHALVGIALDTKAGRHEMSVRATGPAGDKAVHLLTLRVQAKQFETRRLTVEPQFVDPPNEEGPRIAREQARLAATFTLVTERLWRGTFAPPVPGRATSSFGRLTVLNGQARGRHQGADFSAATGTPVRAPNAGRVALAANLYFSGNTIVLDHGNGLFSLFAHLSRMAVEEGVVAAKGDRLGDVGATGRVTGPHLHWAVRLGEFSVDPQSLMAVLAQLPETAAAPAAR
jgi:murein DD-endopeptidase MepM/ murein hydrolase activator NlpD